MKGFEWILEQIIESETPVRQLIKQSDLNNGSFYKMIQDPKLNERYARAYAFRLSLMSDDILEISDDSSNDELETPKGIIENKEFVNRSRLKVDTRKWILSKMMPQKFGDNLEYYDKVKRDEDKESNGDNEIVIKIVGDGNPAQ